MGFLDKLRSGGESNTTDPKSANTLWDSFFKQVMKKDLNGALSTIESLVSVEPNNPQVFLKKAEILQRKNDIEGAVAAYFKAAERLEGGEQGHKAHAIYKIVLRLKPDEPKARKRLSTPPVSKKVQEDMGDGYATTSASLSTENMSGSQEGRKPSEEPSASLDDISTSEIGGGIELSSFDEGSSGEGDGASVHDSDDDEQGIGVSQESDLQVETFDQEEVSAGIGGGEDYEQGVSGASLIADDGTSAEQTDSPSDALDWDDVPAGAEAAEMSSVMGLESSQTAPAVQEETVGTDTDSALDWDDMPAGAGSDSTDSSMDIQAGATKDDQEEAAGTDEVSLSLMGSQDEGAPDDTPAAVEENPAAIAQIDSALWGDDEPVSGESASPDITVAQEDLLATESETAEQQDSSEFQGIADMDDNPLGKQSPVEAATGEIGTPSMTADSPDILEIPSHDEAPVTAGGSPELDSSLWESPEEKTSGQVDEGIMLDEDSPGEADFYSVGDAVDEALPPIFSFLSVEDIESLPEKADHKSYSDGDFVIRENDSSDSMFIIKSGSARVETSLKGKTVRLGGLTQGDFFGEVAFLTGKPRTASVIAEGFLEVMEIDRNLLQSTIDRNPLVLDSLLDMYKNRALDAVKRLGESA